MPTPLENAQLKLNSLRTEVERIERFIRDYREFERGTDGGQGDATGTAQAGGIEGNVSVEKPHHPVDNSMLTSGRRKVRPDEIAQMIERVIREVGQPMTRGQLVEALERRDVDLPAADKARYIGTIIWRHKRIFVNIDGRGYWLRNELQRVPGVAPMTPYSEPDEEHSDELPL